MERPEYRKTFEVGKDKKGRRVFLTVELTRWGPEVTTTGEPIVHYTVTHEKVTEWFELSISGVVQGGPVGQIRDVLGRLSSSVIPTEQIRQIAEVWDRWHLNGMNAGCVHQTKGDYARLEIRSQVCPVGYHYGSAWLVNPLPAEIVDQVKTWGAGQGKRDAYAEQAKEFLQRFGLGIRAAFKGDKCPPWCDGSCAHGDRYRITIRRLRGPDGSRVVPRPYSLSFDSWGSQANSQAGERPSTYGILACVSSDALSPTDPDEVVKEYGEMKPSQALAVARFAAKLQDFFTEAELEALGEIR